MGIQIGDIVETIIDVDGIRGESMKMRVLDRKPGKFLCEGTDSAGYFFSGYFREDEVYELSRKQRFKEE